jgi:hypothetical protein
MLVEVYFVRDGSQQQFGTASYTKSLAACVEDLGLERGHWRSALDDPPRFGDQSLPGSPEDEYKHVVCRIGEEEAAARGWKPGYYRVDRAAEEVIARWGTPRAAWT